MSVAFKPSSDLPRIVSIDKKYLGPEYRLFKEII